MLKIRSPLVGVAIATALASTTGYCVLTNLPAEERPRPPVFQAPVPLLPEAIVPYPLVDLPALPDAE